MMNATTLASNLIPVVDFRVSPVLTDFAVASTPKSEIALRLAAEARDQSGKLATDKRAGLLKTLATTRGDLFQINPYLIRIREGWNSRVASDPANVEHIDNLARSIAEIGVQQPLTVAIEGNFVDVTDGHCRLLATFRAIEVYGAEIKNVPVRAEGRYASEADRVLSQIVRNSGKPLTVLEQGGVFVKLINFGWTPQQIANKAGLGVVRVSQVLDLMAHANTVIKEMVACGRISASTAAQALRDANNVASVAEKALTNAVAVAEASGKKRATAKHVSVATGKVSTKTELRAIFSTAEVVTEKKLTTVSLPSDDWARVVELLNIG